VVILQLSRQKLVRPDMLPEVNLSVIVCQEEHPLEVNWKILPMKEQDEEEEFLRKKKKPTGQVPLGSFIPGGQPEQPQQLHKPPQKQQQHKPPQQPKKPPQQQPQSPNASETGTEKPAKDSNANLSDNEKRRRTIIKKIREIEILKQRQTASEVLNAAQIAKISTEGQLTTELESLKNNKTDTKTESLI